MKLSVVIVSYNVKYYLEQCLHSVWRAAEGIETEIYVVDNHSHDGSVDYLRERFPFVHVIDSNHNLGFSRANNIALRQCRGDYVLLLNPDTIVGENVFHDVLSFMDDHPKAGAVGVRMMNTDGRDARESRRGEPRPLTAFYKMSGLCSLFPKSRRFGKYYMGYLPWEEPVQIEVISGAFFLLRREALDRVGLLDEDFFMYGEDIDLSCRVRAAGFENWYFPVRILHYKGESTKKTSFKYVHVFYDAMLIFFRKHYGHFGIWLSIPVKAAIYLKALMTLVRTLTVRFKKALGFILRDRLPFTDYLFIGRRESMEAFTQIAARKGLVSKAEVEGDASRLPDGHHAGDQLGEAACAALSHVREKNAHPLVVVYDSEAYSYAQILEIFAREPDERIKIGIYHPQRKTIVTADEIFL